MIQTNKVNHDVFSDKVIIGVSRSCSMTQPLAEKTAYKQVYSVLRDTMPMFIGGIQKQKSQKISKGLSAKKHEKFEILKI